MPKNFVAGIYLIIIVAIVGAWYIFSPEHVAETKNTFAVSTTTGHSEEVRQIPDGWREYQSSAYHFSVSYPRELTVNEQPEGGGATTITFQNTEKGEGFQIFILPYSESQVSEARFNMDIPSGVRTLVTNVVIDGATAAAFYSTDALLGETREVWLVHGGFLFEVTTLKSLTAWLTEIIQTWHFM